MTTSKNNNGKYGITTNNTTKTKIYGMTTNDGTRKCSAVIEHASVDSIKLAPIIILLPQHKDLLQLMIDATEEGEGGGGRRLTDEEIVAHSITFLIAGYETTSNALAYTSYLLAVNPEIQEKLQAAIDEYFENSPVSGGVTLDQLTKHVPFPEASLLVTSVVVFVTGLLDT